MTDPNFNNFRKTSQYLLPAIKESAGRQGYDIYPSFCPGENLIGSGCESLAGSILSHSIVIIDGFGGTFFEVFRSEIKRIAGNEKSIKWIDTEDFLKSPELIDEMVAPFLGDDDPLFGTKSTLDIEQFFEIEKLRSQKPSRDYDINIISGTGAELAGWKGLHVYLDVPKNEIQFRARAGSITNFGSKAPSEPKLMYKRSYFTDWPVLNRHKQKILPSIDIIVDNQNPVKPSWMTGETLRKSLAHMSRNSFRVRPWFEPGTWGGSWIRDRIGGLNKNVENYAWSFELITPENGLLFESSGRLLEVSFDFLMFAEAEAVLGDCHDRFGTQFPIRFDYLDTFDGGNLSVQCHPGEEYIRKYFGEDLAQEEAYYIIDTKDKASVYLGFQDDIDPAEFRAELERSSGEGSPVNIQKYVQKHPSAKHDLFLIPPGTIHGSCKNNLVLEISSTPYIFTFKMYDWLRPDLDGKPRPLNIGRGIENLDFDRKGSYVRENLLSKPVLISEDQGWSLWHLPTHKDQLYDIHRFHIKDSVDVETAGKFHVLCLVEGKKIRLETKDGLGQVFSFGETFVIPAAAGSYRIINLNETEAVVIKAFVKSAPEYSE